jgi:FkbM family methyltransferase
LRILLAHNSPYYPSHSGGDKSNRLLMEALAARGHHVRVVARVEQFGAASHSRLAGALAARGIALQEESAGVAFRLHGVEARILTRGSCLRGYFAAQAEAFDPDIIVTSTDDPARLMLDTALRRPQARVVYLVRATVALPFGPHSSVASAYHSRVLRQVDGVAAVSEYVARYTRQWGGLPAVHVPISLLDPGEPANLGAFENRFVSMVNPCAVKGIAIFLALAERFPDVEFAAVPAWGTTAADLAAMRRLANVAILAPFENIDDLLRQTRVMLAPSLWAEARSRVILEAMSRGVPVMASDVGGLAEAHLGVDYLLPVNQVTRYRPAVDERMVPVADIPVQDTRPWEAALARLLSDRGHYGELATQSRAVALDYARGLNVLPFENYLESVLRAAPARSSPPREFSGERRRLLALRLTRLARAALPGVDIEVLWDGMWIRRVGADYFPDPDMLGGQPNWQAWAQQAGKYLRDAEDYWFYLYRPQPGDTIVDIGAGRGEDVLAFSRAAGPGGRVWAIEPHPVSLAVLRRFCQLNRLDNVKVLPYACVDQAGDVPIETLPVWESNYVRGPESGPTGYAVKGVRFDDVAAERGITRIDLLKMNIEGAERLALPGCREALRRTRFVCIAAHDFRAARGEGEHFRTLEYVCEFLTRAGFQVVLREDPRYYVPYHVHGYRA